MNQGATANYSGATAEALIVTVLTRQRIRFDRQKEICRGIYDTPIRTDFYLPDYAPSGLAIESKWQAVGGSADEKLPYLVENIRRCFPCPAVIVIDGQGFRSGAVAWLGTQVDGQSLLAVFSLTEFVTWVQRGCKTP